MVMVQAPPFQTRVFARSATPAVYEELKNVTGAANESREPIATRPVPASEAAFAVDTAAPNWKASQVPPAVVLLVR
jgi:hypothetical protein